jgi:hypothetical protein
MAGNKLLNYTTSKEPLTSAGEITSLLVRKGARSISQEFEDGVLIGISFIFPVGGKPVTFKLPAREEGVFAFMLKQEPWNTRRGKPQESYCAHLRAQASRVAWRILKDWVEAQVAMVETEQAAMGEVFMPYAIANSDGRTMYELFVVNNQRQLGS